MNSLLNNILLDQIDDGSEVIAAIRKRANKEAEKMSKYLFIGKTISKAS